MADRDRQRPPQGPDSWREPRHGQDYRDDWGRDDRRYAPPEYSQPAHAGANRPRQEYGPPPAPKKKPPKAGYAILAIAVVIAVIIVGGTLAKNSDKTVSTTSAPVTTAASTTPDSADSPAESGPEKPAFNALLTITEDGSTAGYLSVSPPQPATSFDDGFTTPTNGPAFTTFMVHYKAGSKPGLDYNPFDFYVRRPDGSHIQPGIGRDPSLDSGTLNAGETASGYLTFDAGPHGTLVYAPNFTGGSLAEWSY